MQKTIKFTNMKKLLLSLAFILIAGTATQTAFEVSAKKETTVYVCTGPKSKRYHATSSCKGLNRCSRDIVSMPQSEAAQKGFTPCKICY